MKRIAVRSVVRVTVAAAAAAAFLLFAASAGQAGRGTIIAPCCFDYGTITVGQTRSVTFELSSTKGSVSGITITLTGSAAFTITADGCTGATVSPKKPCDVTVQYAPATAGGSDSATLTITQTKPVASASIALTGKGGGAVSRHLYWANLSASTIGRANADGTGVNQSFITGATVPYGVAVDSNFVYWTNINAGTIGRANLDGTGANQNFITGARRPGGGGG